MKERYDTIEEQYKVLIAKVTSSASSSNAIMEAIQANINAILASQESMTAKLEKLKEENKSLDQIISSLYLTVSSLSNDVKRGKDKRRPNSPLISLCRRRMLINLL